MRVGVHPRLDRDLLKVPVDVYAWTLDWIDAAKQSPELTLAAAIEGASRLKSGEFRNCYVRKWRRKASHGEYRLVFRATEDQVFFFSLEPRGSNYKIARRRIRAVPR